MALSASAVTQPLLTFSPRKIHLRISPNCYAHSFITQNKPLVFKQITSLKPSKCSLSPHSARGSSDDFVHDIIEREHEHSFEKRPIESVIWALIWVSLSLVWFAASGDANATAADSIRASSFGFKIATALRSSGWPDEAVVFALATLPVIELRGAIPVGYWLQLKPTMLTILSVLGLVFFFSYLIINAVC